MKHSIIKVMFLLFIYQLLTCNGSHVKKDTTSEIDDVPIVDQQGDSLEEDVICDTEDSIIDYEEWSECEVIGTECSPDDLVYYFATFRDENERFCWDTECPGRCDCGFIEYQCCCDPIWICNYCSDATQKCLSGRRVFCKGADETGEQFIVKEGCCNEHNEACCHLDPAPCSNRCIE